MTDSQRRRFLNRSVALGLAAGTGLGRVAQADADESTATRPKIAAFTKSFQDWPIPRVCAEFKRIGLDGLDLTVRPGGHIKPEDVRSELPKAAKAAEAAGVEITQVTTAITEPDQSAENILATCQQLGIGKIKLGYFRYRQFGGLKKELDRTRRKLEGLAKLARKYEVLPCVHVHSGAFLPSHGTQLYQLIHDRDPAEIGAYVDVLHMVLEGGRDGWRQGLDLLAPWIALCAVKNFRLEPGERDKTGQLRWERKNVPIADGVSPLPDFVAALKKLGYEGPYSLHSEYKGGHSFRNLDTAGCLEQTRKDLEFFRPLLT